MSFTLHVKRVARRSLKFCTRARGQCDVIVTGTYVKRETQEPQQILNGLYAVSFKHEPRKN